MKRVRSVLRGSATTLSFACASVASAATEDTVVAPPPPPIERPTTAPVEPQIVIANPGTLTTARDPVNVTGIGQMIVDQQNGFIGLCTGTLINPRTVIFAAHCVNGRAASSYGSNSGGQPIAFGFGSNNNLAGNSAFGQWLGTHRTNTANFLYNVNQVAYNRASLEPDANSFLYSDIALASLDTAAGNIPTWALLFSALPATTITAAGTGYHVLIDGYGNNGTGTTGSTGGIDYRRRIAENTLGALASIDDFEGFIFGVANTLPQNLYWIDFDDPRRGTAGASPFDFNAWRDTALPNEGNTASGDSGGPLILDRAFARQLVIGVLSGGYTRFFGDQPANGYGTTSFYQPLYLYWDWIAANNPYHYVSGVAGNRDWNDPAHWVSNIDPNYQIIGPNGAIVTGVPTMPGAGNTAQPGFGQVCIQSSGSGDCFDIATRTETFEATGHPIGTGAVTGGTGGAAQGGQGSNGQGIAAALPPATLLNGLPGATDFVPDNTAGDRLSNTPARYFDVTLSATGTTTLSSAVAIDRFGIAGTGAMLDVTPTGVLTSGLGFNQITGTVQVNGLLTTPADYFLLTGGLSGTGTIRSAFFTSVAGTIAPGTPTTIGTLNFQGNVILASGNVLLVNLGQDNTSDRVAVTTGAAIGSGIANVGGFVGFSPVPGHTIRAGDVYTIVTAQGGITGSFASPAALSAILTPRFTYTANAVTATIDAGLYANVVGTSPVQRAYAQLLDQNRGAGYADIYGPLDLQNAATIQTTLDGLAPRNQTLKRALGTLVVDTMLRFTQQRLIGLTPGNLDGTLSIIGNPLRLTMPKSSAVDVGRGASGIAAATTLKTGTLPEGVSGFIAAGYLDADSRPMATAIPLGGRDRSNGFYVAGGIEREAGSHGAIGISISYGNVDGTTTFAQQARAELFQGSVYGKIAVAGHLALDAQMSVGVVTSATRRLASVIGTTYTLSGTESAVTYTGALGLGYAYGVGGGLTITPRAAVRAGRIGWEGGSETGGGTALRIDRLASDSIQGMGGLTIFGGTTIKPHVSAYYVHDFIDRPTVFGANFVGGPGAGALFGLAGQDQDWAEVAGGLSYGSRTVSVAVGAATTIGRGDVSNQSYHASVKIGF